MTHNHDQPLLPIQIIHFDPVSRQIVRKVSEWDELFALHDKVPVAYETPKFFDLSYVMQFAAIANKGAPHEVRQSDLR